MSILIKGAGVAGLVLAYELRRRGLDVTLNDTSAHAGHGASHYAGGMLAPWCERESASEAVFDLGQRLRMFGETIDGSFGGRGQVVLHVG